MSQSRVFIGRLSLQARERDVESFLRGYGRIRDVSLKRGYGFVEFDDYRDAEDAIYDLNGTTLLGERVSLELARGRRRGGYGGGGGSSRGGGHGGSKYGAPVRTEHRVVVKNLSSRTSWQDLKDYLRQAGNVTYADAHKKKVGEGVVEFSSSSEMLNAIKELDDTDLGGRKIRIIEDKDNMYSPPQRRSYGRRSHSRSRSRSRSHSPRRRSHSHSPRRRSRSYSPKARSPKARSPKVRSRSKSRSDSRSPPRQKVQRSLSRSRSRSRSRSPPRQRKDSHSRGDRSD